MDCHEFTSAKTHNDENAKSHNGGIIFPSLANVWLGVGFFRFHCRHCENSAGSRGNPYPQSEKRAFNKPNKIDCHALDSAKTQNLIARNDDNACHTEGVARSIQKESSANKAHL